MIDEDDFEKQEVGLRASLREKAKRAIALRSKDREFHGLEREFVYHQAQMSADYERTRDLKHPRDMGNARENILQRFLLNSGYIPKRYAISDRSVRVVSTTGHISNEIDIAFYDPTDSLTLMKRQDVYEVYPIESIYGVIQVKSILTKKELQSGLKNIASFKKLDRPENESDRFVIINGKQKSNRGFGILFAYSSNMKWKEVIEELDSFQKVNPSRNLPNAVFILDRGFFLFGDGEKAAFHNTEMETISSLVIHGFPDREAMCLYHFQNIVLNLLRSTEIYPAQLERYFRLPLIANDYSYSFMLGAMSEIGNCEKHGDFARKIRHESLEKLIQWCETAEPINWIKATNIAYGLPENEEAYRRQPGDVRIYNPEELPLSEILLTDNGYLFNGKSIRLSAYDMIDANGITICLPYYYSTKEGLIQGCLKCNKQVNSSRKQTKSND